MNNEPISKTPWLRCLVGSGPHLPPRKLWSSPPSRLALLFLRLVHILLWLALWGGASAAYGAANSGVAGWDLTKDKRHRLTIHLEDQLTKKQKNLITSGFATFTTLEIVLPEGRYTSEEVLFRSQCTVTYDTWEEYFDIVKIGTTLTKVSEFKTFADQCLTALIEEHPSFQYFLKFGGQIKATLKLDQIEPERAQEVRNWLIKQQSGVVKGLFSHMLGDLQLSEILFITIQIPPFATNIDPEKEREIMALYPEKAEKHSKK